MNKDFCSLTALFAAVLLAAAMLPMSCNPALPATPKDLAQDALLPRPVSLEATGSSFRLTEKTDIYVEAGNPELERLGQYLAGLLNPATGLSNRASP